MKQTMRVLVSGAGICGPTLAYFLAKTGAQVTIVEKAASLLPHGQNIDISGSARTVIRQMGVYDEVKKCNTTEKGTQFIDPKSRPFAILPVDGISPTSELEILRGDLAKVLYIASKDLENVEYLFGTTITNVVSNDEHSVKVELSDGSTKEYDLLVAADGQWSRVRKQVFAPQVVTTVDKGLYMALFTVPRTADDNDWWNIYQALRSRAMFTRPDPYGTIRAGLHFMPRDDAVKKKEWEAATRGTKEQQFDVLRKEFVDAGWIAPRLLKAMEDAPDFYFNDIKQIRMSTWSNGRVVCIGDAAYAPTPFTGMGTSLAILGAYVLAGELSKLEVGEHPSRALAAYDTALRPFVEKIQDIPSFVPGIVHPEVQWKRSAFSAFITVIAWIFGAIARVPWLLKKLKAGDEKDYELPAYPVLERGS